MTKCVTLEGLEYYHKRLMKTIDAKIDLGIKGKTNCPNCGAVITSTKCEYCGTDFMAISDIMKNSKTWSIC